MTVAMLPEGKASLRLDPAECKPEAPPKAAPERPRTLPPWWEYQDSAPLDLWSLPRIDVESGAANDPEVR